MNKISAIVATAALALSLGIAPADAGGLFGKGGLIRGDVGNFLDKHVEKPITTPLARGAVEAGGAVVGGAVGGYVGGPTGAAIGAPAGRYVGQQINRCAAGQCNPVGRPAHPAAAPSESYARSMPPMQHPIGNACLTQAGMYYGPPNPVGATCVASTPWGFYQGRVVLR